MPDPRLAQILKDVPRFLTRDSQVVAGLIPVNGQLDMTYRRAMLYADVEAAFLLGLQAQDEAGRREPCYPEPSES